MRGMLLTVKTLVNCALTIYSSVIKKTSKRCNRIETGIQRWEVVPDGRFWLGEKVLEVCSKAMLKDLIARDLKGR